MTDSTGDSSGKTKPDGRTESSRGEKIGFPTGNRGITHLRLCSANQPQREGGEREGERSGCPESIRVKLIACVCVY